MFVGGFEFVSLERGLGRVFLGGVGVDRVVKLVR